MAKDIHEKAFGDGTKTKLELVRLYIREWLPVFFKHHSITWKEIEIYDYFAASGTDTEGNYGSPLILLEELTVYCLETISKNIKVRLIVNDYDKNKIAKLETNIKAVLEKCRKGAHCVECKKSNRPPFEIQIENRDFSEFFNSKFLTLKENTSIPRFMFIDQYGMKFVTPELFKKLTGLERTDILFFISSSHVKRFAEQKEFQHYLKISRQVFDENKPAHVHRVISDYFKSQKPAGKEYYLSSFSLKKESNPNIYGLIFGSNHPLGIEKFLNVAWKIDKNTGEADYNIDNDGILEGKISLFPEDNVIRKLDKFKTDLLQYMSQPRTNKDVYIFSLESGISIKKSNDILKSLEKDGKLNIVGIDRQKGAFYLSFNHKKEISIAAK